MNNELRRYHVPTTDGLEGWGIFVIGMDGYFSVVSDYGNYAFRWGYHGENDFRRFLIDLDEGYLCSKLGRSDHYDGDATLDKVKAAIAALPSRQDAEIDLLDEHSDLNTREDFALWHSETRLPEAYEHFTTDYDPQLKAFAQKLWPRFAALLRAELEAERVAAGASAA